MRGRGECFFGEKGSEKAHTIGNDMVIEILCAYSAMMLQCVMGVTWHWQRLCDVKKNELIEVVNVVEVVFSFQQRVI